MKLDDIKFMELKLKELKLKVFFILFFYLIKTGNRITLAFSLILGIVSSFWSLIYMVLI